MGRRIRFRILSIAFFALLTLGIRSEAIAQTAQIRVDTSDGTGAVVPGVAVTVVNTDTGTTHGYSSDSAGLVVAPGLQPGPYKITAAASGFATSERTLTITVGEVAEVKFVLTLAGSSQSVDVQAESGLEIETAKSDVSGVISRTQLDQLPVINRGFIGLAQLLPGGAHRSLQTLASATRPRLAARTCAADIPS